VSLLLKKTVFKAN